MASEAAFRDGLPGDALSVEASRGPRPATALGLFRVLGGDIVRYGILGGLAKGISFLLLPVLTRLFSPDQFGVYDIVATAVTLTTTTMVVDLNGALARFYDEYRARGGGVYSSALLFVAVWGGILAVAGSIACPLLARAFPREAAIFELLGFAVWIAWFMGLNQVGDMVLRMQKRIVAYNALAMLEAAVFLSVAIIGLTWFHLGLKWVFISQLCGVVVHAALLAAITREELLRRPSAATLRRALRFSLPMFPAIFVGWANRQADRAILLVLIGTGAVGIYVAGARLANMVGYVMVMFNMAWLPFSMSIIGEDAAVRGRVYSSMLRYFLGVFLAASLCVSGFGPEIATTIVTREYVQAATFLPWLLGAVVLHQSGNMVNIGTLVSEDTWINAVAASVGLAVNALLCILLVRRYGAAGAAYGTFLGELCVCAVVYTRTQKSGVAAFDTRVVLGLLGTYILASALIRWLDIGVAAGASPLRWRGAVAVGGALAIGALAFADLRAHAPRLLARLPGPGRA